MSTFQLSYLLIQVCSLHIDCLQFLILFPSTLKKISNPQKIAHNSIMNTLYTLHLYSPIASVQTLPPLSTLRLTLKLSLSLLFTDFPTCDISHPNSLAAHLCQLIMSANLALHRCFLQCPRAPTTFCIRPLLFPFLERYFF